MQLVLERVFNLLFEFSWNIVSVGYIPNPREWFRPCESIVM